MLLYRVVQDRARTGDLSGKGAFMWGGRWNSKGTYMLYTSENSSLAYLENLVYFDKSLFPPQLYIIQINVDDAAPVFIPADKDYPVDWMKLGQTKNQEMGDRWMSEKKYLGIKVRSAINIYEYNYLLNPLFPRYHDLVTVSAVSVIDVDGRLVK